MVRLPSLCRLAADEHDQAHDPNSAPNTTTPGQGRACTYVYKIPDRRCEHDAGDRHDDESKHSHGAVRFGPGGSPWCVRTMIRLVLAHRDCNDEFLALGAPNSGANVSF